MDLRNWDKDKIKTHQSDAIICIPSGNNMVSTIAMCIWARALKSLAPPLGSLVGEMWDFSPIDIGRKRDQLVRNALATGTKNILFVSDDVALPHNTLIRMLERRRQGARVITGVYWTKSNPSYPYIFKNFLSSPFWGWDRPDGTYKPWHVGDFFKIDWSGCDCLMIDADVFRELKPPWFSIDYTFLPNGEQSHSGTEDLYFFSKLKEAGIPVWCDAGIQCEHIERTSGLVYRIPHDCPNAHLGSEIVRKNPILVADLGAGRRQNPLVYEGADIVRFDGDPNCDPDVICDVRRIPDLDEKYDVVTALHVLEHLPADDPIKAVQEWTRILKTGGKLIICVPNVAVPMRHILDGAYTPYDHQMIYGTQATSGEFHQNGFLVDTLRNIINLAGNLEITSLTLEPNPFPEAEIRIEATKMAHKATESVDKVWTVPQKGDCACE